MKKRRPQPKTMKPGTYPAVLKSMTVGGSYLKIIVKLDDQPMIPRGRIRCEDYLTESRQNQLVELAPEFPANAIRLAIRETIEALRQGHPVDAYEAVDS